MDFSKRSYEEELLDQKDIPQTDIRRNMEELNVINKYLGGHKITISGVKDLITSNSGRRVICEVGCGGGDNLAAIQQWLKIYDAGAELIGIDINPYCITVASENLSAYNPTLICSDYRDVNFGATKPDIIFSSLFCHHFKEAELVNMLQWMRDNARIGFFINDLNRHILAYYSIRLLTGLFSSSYLVKNDAPLSVLRGFKMSEWKVLLGLAGIRQYAISWKWAFRHLIVVKNPGAAG